MAFWSGITDWVDDNILGGHGSSAHNWFVGGDATKNLPTGPKGYDAATAQLGDIAGGAQGRMAPTANAYQLGPAAQLNANQMNQSRAGAMSVGGQLGRIASGQQMGAGELAVNRNVSGAQAAQNAMARMARGPTGALAFRNAARNSADIGLAGAGQAAQARMADQQSALGQQAGLFNSLYGQDANVAAQQAQLQQQQMLSQGQLGQQAALANQQAQLQQTSLNDQRQLAALAQMLGWDQATLDAAYRNAAAKAGDQGALGSFMGSIGGIMAAAQGGGGGGGGGSWGGMGVGMANGAAGGGLAGFGL